MKANIHPNWHSEAKVICVCGNTFTTGSTIPLIKVELCSNCHPLYTGQQKLVDTLGQVDKFQKIKATSEAKRVERAKIVESRAAKVSKSRDENKLSLRDLLTQARKGPA